MKSPRAEFQLSSGISNLQLKKMHDSTKLSEAGMRPKILVLGDMLFLALLHAFASLSRFSSLGSAQFPSAVSLLILFSCSTLLLLLLLFPGIHFTFTIVTVNHSD